MQEQFLELIAEERERGCAVFISSHELDEVERVCDRVGIVRGGRLIAVERIDDLLGKAKRRVSLELAGPANLEGAARPARRQRPGGEATAGSASASPATSTLRSRRSPHQHVVDIEIAHPTLEEVFLTYYEEGGSE